MEEVSRRTTGLMLSPGGQCQNCSLLGGVGKDTHRIRVSGGEVHVREVFIICTVEQGLCGSR